MADITSFNNQGSEQEQEEEQQDTQRTDGVAKRGQLAAKRKIEEMQYLKSLKQTYFDDLDNKQSSREYKALLEEMSWRDGEE